MLELSQIQIGQRYNLCLEAVDVTPGGVTFAMPSGVHVFLYKKNLSIITPASAPELPEESTPELPSAE